MRNLAAVVSLVAVASPSRADAPGNLWTWLAAEWHWLWALLTSGVIGGLAVKYGPDVLKVINDERQRRNEDHAVAVAQRTHDRARLGPGLRTLIGVGHELEGIAVRLTHDPANEAVAEVGRLTELRVSLNTVQEPELAPLRDLSTTP